MQISPVAVRTNVNNYKSRNRENVHRSFGNQSSNQSFTGAGSDLVLSFRSLFSAKSRAASESLVNKVLLSENDFDIMDFAKIFDSLLESPVSKKAQKSSEEMLSKLGEKFGNDEGVVKVAFSQIKQSETAQGTQKLLKAGFNPFIMNSVFDSPVISFLKSGENKSLSAMLDDPEIFRYLPVTKKEDSSLVSCILYHFNPFLNNNGFMSKIYDSNSSSNIKEQVLQKTKDKILRRIPDAEFKKSINEMTQGLIKSSLVYDYSSGRKIYGRKETGFIVSPMIGDSRSDKCLIALSTTINKSLRDGLISPEKFKELFWLSRHNDALSSNAPYTFLLTKYINGDSRINEKYFEELIDSLFFNDSFKSFDSNNNLESVFSFIKLYNINSNRIFDLQAANLSEFNDALQGIIQGPLNKKHISVAEREIDRVARLAYVGSWGGDYISDPAIKAYFIRKSLDNISENSYLRMSKLNHYLELMQESKEMQAADETLISNLRAAIEYYKDLPVTKYTNDVKKDKFIEDCMDCKIKLMER